MVRDMVGADIAGRYRSSADQKRKETSPTGVGSAQVREHCVIARSARSRDSRRSTTASCVLPHARWGSPLYSGRHEDSSSHHLRKRSQNLQRNRAPRVAAEAYRALISRVYMQENIFRRYAE